MTWSKFLEFVKKSILRHQRRKAIFSTMLKNYILKFVIILNAAKYCESILTNTQQNIIRSLNEELKIKHVSIIKYDHFPIDQEIFRFAKRIFNGNIFMSFMTLSEMNVSMNEYYHMPLDYFLNLNTEKRIKLMEKRRPSAYPPRTMVMPYGERVKYSIGELFTEENKAVVSKYTWLIFDENNSFKLIKNSEQNYIPFNCQFLIVKNITKEHEDYGIEEIYHPSIETNDLFVRHFGNWNEAKSLTVPEPDFYKRRLDMNGTVLVAIYNDQSKIYMSSSLNVAKIISRRMNIRWKLKHWHLNNGKNYEAWAIDLWVSLISSVNFFPNIIGPLSKGVFHFLLAYDKKYEQYGLSPLIKPFSFNLWMAVLAWLIISAISITIIVKRINKSLKNNLGNKIVTSDCSYEPFDSILNQDGGKTPAQSSIQIMSIATRIVPLVLAPIYTGTIASFIVTPVINLPFTNPKEFVQDGSYIAGFCRISVLDEIFKASKDVWLQEMYRNLMMPIDESQVVAVDQGLKKMCDNYKFALLVNSDDELVDVYCKIIQTRSPVLFTWSMLRVYQESPYQAIFNRIVTWIRTTGNFRDKIPKFSAEGGRDFTIIEPKNNNDEDVDIHLAGLAPIFILTCVIYAFSIIILFIEIRWKKNT